MLKSLSDDGVTIFLSSHLVDEVSRVASRIGILHRGVLIREVNSKTLANELQKTLVVRIDDVKKCSELMASLGYHFSVAANASELISADGVAIANRHQIARHIVHGGIKLYELFIREEDLEKYFLRQIGRMTNHE